jgi:hypothetical protein
VTDSTFSIGFHKISKHNECHRKYWYPTHQQLNLRSQMLLAEAENCELNTRAVITNSFYTVTCLLFKAYHPVRELDKEIEPATYESVPHQIKS